MKSHCLQDNTTRYDSFFFSGQEKAALKEAQERERRKTAEEKFKEWLAKANEKGRDSPKTPCSSASRNTLHFYKTGQTKPEKVILFYFFCYVVTFFLRIQKNATCVYD